MKVQIVQTVEVDIEKWAAEYCIEPTARAVREDVKAYFAYSAQEQIDALDCAPDDEEK